jgi:hypothetical protein
VLACDEAECNKQTATRNTHFIRCWGPFKAQCSTAVLLSHRCVADAEGHTWGAHGWTPATIGMLKDVCSKPASQRRPSHSPANSYSSVGLVLSTVSTVKVHTPCRYSYVGGINSTIYETGTWTDMLCASRLSQVMAVPHHVHAACSEPELLIDCNNADYLRLCCATCYLLLYPICRGTKLHLSRDVTRQYSTRHCSAFDTQSQHCWAGTVPASLALSVHKCR